MEEIARVYAEALFEAAKDDGEARRDPRAARRSSPTRSNENRDLQVFFFSPYFSSTEKRDGIAQAISGAEPELVNFLELLAEKHRMPAIFRIREPLRRALAEENKRLEVTLTSAVELDPSVVERVGEEIEQQTERRGRADEPRSTTTILGGLVLRVGNMVLDASIRNRLEKLRKEVAAARLRPTNASIKELDSGDQARRDRQDPAERIEGLDDRRRRPLRGRAPCSRSPTASPASTGSTTACRSRCSSCPTT